MIWHIAEGVSVIDNEDGTVTLVTPSGSTDFNYHEVQEVRAATGEWLLKECRNRSQRRPSSETF